MTEEIMCNKTLFYVTVPSNELKLIMSSIANSRLLLEQVKLLVKSRGAGLLEDINWKLNMKRILVAKM